MCELCYKAAAKYTQQLWLLILLGACRNQPQMILEQLAPQAL